MKKCKILKTTSNRLKYYIGQELEYKVLDSGKVVFLTDTGRAIDISMMGYKKFKHLEVDGEEYKNVRLIQSTNNTHYIQKIV